MQCRHWSAKALEVYRGPWTVADGLKKTKCVSLSLAPRSPSCSRADHSFCIARSYPIVFFSLDADPVTPLSAAVKMQAGFGNSSSTLVTQSGCVLLSQRFCTLDLAGSSVCDADSSPPAQVRSLLGRAPVPLHGQDDPILLPRRHCPSAWHTLHRRRRLPVPAPEQRQLGGGARDAVERGRRAAQRHVGAVGERACGGYGTASMSWNAGYRYRAERERERKRAVLGSSSRARPSRSLAARSLASPLSRRGKMTTGMTIQPLRCCLRVEAVRQKISPLVRLPLALSSPSTPCASSSPARPRQPPSSPRASWSRPAAQTCP